MENEWDGKVRECEKMREGRQPTVARQQRLAGARR